MNGASTGMLVCQISAIAEHAVGPADYSPAELQTITKSLREAADHIVSESMTRTVRERMRAGE